MKHGAYVIVLVLQISTTFLAQGTLASSSCPERPTDPEQAQKLAGQFFAQSESAFKENRYDEALGGFICSLRMFAHEHTIFNIAHVAVLVKDRELTIRILQDYASDHPQGDATAEIQKIIAELEGKRQPDMTAAPPPPSAPEPRSASGDDTNGENPSNARNLKISGWLFTGLGGLSAIAAGVLQGMSSAAEDDALSATTYKDFVSERDTRDSLQIGATVGFIAAGALAGTGVTLLLFSHKNEKENRNAISLRPTTQGLILEGQF